MDSTRRLRRGRNKRVAVAAAIATGGLVVTACAAPAHAARPHATTSAFVRVDQAGFLPGDVKQAYVMAAGAVSGAKYAVVDSSGATVQSGSVGTASRGSWNPAYPDVYPITFTGLKTAGTYRVKVTGGASATSPSFEVEDAAALYGKLVADGVSFYQTQRDGADVVPGALGRKPSHLNDAKATVYNTPHFQSDSDTITDKDLTKAGVTADVEGGWFDAGDYLKFTHTAAYGDVLLFASARQLGVVRAGAPAGRGALRRAVAGRRCGTRRPRRSTCRSASASGDDAGTFIGDHDMLAAAGGRRRRHRVRDRYAAPPAGLRGRRARRQPISPNLAGRVAAAFALAAQVDATADHPRGPLPS